MRVWAAGTGCYVRPYGRLEDVDSRGLLGFRISVLSIRVQRGFRCDSVTFRARHLIRVAGFKNLELGLLVQFRYKCNVS